MRSDQGQLRPLQGVPTEAAPIDPTPDGQSFYSKAQLEHLARCRAEIEGLLGEGRRMTRHVEHLVEDWLDELERAPPQRPGP